MLRYLIEEFVLVLCIWPNLFAYNIYLLVHNPVSSCRRSPFYNSFSYDKLVYIVTNLIQGSPLPVGLLGNK